MSGETFDWYYVGSGGQIGPLSESQIVDLAAHAVIQKDTLVWKPGMEQWVPAGSVPVLASKIQPTWTPPAQSAPPPIPGSLSTASPRIKCPRDGAELRHEVKDRVEIDYCPQCRGVWLDRGELERLTQSERDYYRRNDDDDDDDRRRGAKKKGGFLDNMFDMFD